MLSPLLVNNIKQPASAQFIGKVNQGLDSIPIALQGKMLTADWTIQTGRFLTDIFPELHQAEPPRGRSIAIPWDSLDGVCYYSEEVPGTGSIGITEYCQSDSYTPVRRRDYPNDPRIIRLRPVLWPVPQGEKVLLKNIKPERGLHHEMGHVLDSLEEFPSESVAFETSYRQDFLRIRPENQNKWHYYIQPDKDGIPSKAGFSETFAEAFASLCGGGCIEIRLFQRQFPNSVGFVARLLQKFQG